MSAKFAPLRRCPGPGDEGCGALIDETRRLCAACRQEVAGSALAPPRPPTPPPPVARRQPKAKPPPNMKPCPGPEHFQDCPDEAVVNRNEGKRCPRCKAERERRQRAGYLRPERPSNAEAAQ